MHFSKKYIDKVGLTDIEYKLRTKLMFTNSITLSEPFHYCL